MELATDKPFIVEKVKGHKTNAPAPEPLTSKPARSPTRKGASPEEHRKNHREELEAAIASALDVPAVPEETYAFRLWLAVSNAAPSWPVGKLWMALRNKGHRTLALTVQSVAFGVKNVPASTGARRMRRNR